MGLIHISLDAISITFRDSLFVKGSARFLSVCIYDTVITEDHVWFEDRWMVASLCDE
jgi:hypothetical protein